jgi:hypothetical protein
MAAKRSGPTRTCHRHGVAKMVCRRSGRTVRATERIAMLLTVDYRLIEDGKPNPAKGGDVVVAGYQRRLPLNCGRRQFVLRWIGCQRPVCHAKTQAGWDLLRFPLGGAEITGGEMPSEQPDSPLTAPPIAFLRDQISQVWPDSASSGPKADPRCSPQRHGCPTPEQKSASQSVRRSWALCQLIAVRDTGAREIPYHHPCIGGDKPPRALPAFVVERCGGVPPSRDAAAERRRWGRSLAAENPTVAMIGQAAGLVTARGNGWIPGRDRGVANLLSTTAGRFCGRLPAQKTRAKTAPPPCTKRKRRATRRKWHEKCAPQLRDQFVGNDTIMPDVFAARKVALRVSSRATTDGDSSRLASACGGPRSRVIQRPKTAHRLGPSFHYPLPQNAQSVRALTWTIGPDKPQGSFNARS